MPHADRGRQRAGAREDVERALVTAHHVDVDVGAGGSRHMDGGRHRGHVLHLHVRRGGYDDTPREAMGPLRETEQQAAAALGVKDVRFLRCPDAR